MHRIYVRKTQPKYTNAELEIARLKVEEGRSIYAVSKELGIPYETLRRWVVGTPQRIGSGRSTVLSEKEEKLIVQSLKFLADSGFPWDRSDLVGMVENFIKEVKRPNPFTNDRPGEAWILGFEKRWASELSRRKPELLTKARAEGLSDNVVHEFYTMYAKILKDNNLHDQPDRIFNLDEAGLGTDPISAKVFVPKASRNAYMNSACAGKMNYSVLFCVSASGWYLPPFIVYKGLHLYDSWTKNGPPGAWYAVTKSGWMEDTVFESWFKQFVISVTHIEKPLLLIFDGHGSHLTFNTIKIAMDNNIIILCLPPNTSHAFQPLDVGVFGQLKLEWKRILKRWFRESRLKKVDKAVFPSLAKKLFENVSERNAMAGFRGTGLFSFNREAVQHGIVVHTNPSHIQPQQNPEYASQQSSNETAKSPPSSPLKELKKAIVNTLSPQPSSSTGEAMKNSQRKRKRVQAKVGEVLTTEQVAARLCTEEQARNTKKAKKVQTAKRIEATHEIEVKPKVLTAVNPVIGDWVLVKFSVKKTVQEFTGLIIDIPDEGEYTVKFATKSSAGLFYVFPEKDDIADVQASQIIRKLSQPSCNSRCQYTFCT